MSRLSALCTGLLVVVSFLPVARAQSSTGELAGLRIETAPAEEANDVRGLLEPCPPELFSLIAGGLETHGASSSIRPSFIRATGLHFVGWILYSSFFGACLMSGLPFDGAPQQYGTPLLVHEEVVSSPRAPAPSSGLGGGSWARAATVVGWMSVAVGIEEIDNGDGGRDVSQPRMHLSLSPLGPASSAGLTISGSFR